MHVSRLMKLLLAIVLLTWPLAHMSSAQAQASSMTDVVSLQLVDAGRHGDARLAAVVLRLADGWKTYWRVPGEGGVPPRFDFSGSQNVAGVQVLWPAPKRFSDPITGETIGFKHMVVFPLLVRLQDPASPATLHLKMDYGVCGRMCVPMHAEQTLTLQPDARPDAAVRILVRQWLARTPQGGDAQVKVAQARLLDDDGRLALELTLKGKQAHEVRDAFVEGVELAVFGKPQRVVAQDDALTLRMAVRGLVEKRDLAGKTLHLTLVLNGEKAIERIIRLP